MISELWNKLLDMLGRGGSRASGREAAGVPEARLRELIEEVVEETDPRIRALGNYRRALSPSVAQAFGYVTGLVGQIPPAIPIDAQAWATDALVQALFSGVNDLQRVFSKSPDLRKFFDRHPEGGIDHCYVQVGMAMREKTVLGMKLEGEQVRKDVRQTSVSFYDYRVLLASETEEKLREALAMRGFRLLVSYAQEQITDRHNRIALLEQQRYMLNARLRTARARAAGLEGLVADEGEPSPQVEALEQELAQTEESLQDAKTGFGTLEDYVRCISEVLGQPEAHVRMTPRTLFLNRMNVKLDDAKVDGAREIGLTEVALGEEIKRMIVLARFPRDLLLEKGHFLREAERYYS
jgi:hypothetical protein